MRESFSRQLNLLLLNNYQVNLSFQKEIQIYIFYEFPISGGNGQSVSGQVIPKINTAGLSIPIKKS